MKISPPKYINSLLLRLETSGFEAYLVGGSVRDMLMDRRPHDWDICTSAHPSQVMALFPHHHPTGLKHGTITVVFRGACTEVTTFRSDGQYSDHRRPESVRFIPDLSGDLQRRDFTMNAIALSLTGKLHDPYCGYSDIKNKIIRCVGVPDKRFQEDALRMIRALRFSAVLGFEIEANTLASIEKNAPLCKHLAPERVTSELEKILLSPAPNHISKLLTLNLLCGLATDGASPTDFSSIKKLPKNRQLRWAGLSALMLKHCAIDSAEDFLSRLRLSSDIISFAGRGAMLAMQSKPKTDLDYKQLLAKNGEDCCFCLAAALDALYGEGHLRHLRKIIKSGQCYCLKDLEIKGTHLISLGYSGHGVGRVLNDLLQHVLEFPEDNKLNKLMEIAK